MAYPDDATGMDPQTFALMQPGAAVGPQAPTAPGQQQLDPALVQQMLSLQAQAPKTAQAQRQLALADKLRAGAAGMAKSQSPINTPNIMGALAQGLAGYKANQLEQGASNEMARLGNERQAAYRKYMEGVTGVTPTPDPAAGGALPGDY